MLAPPSLWKTTNKSAKYEIMKSFFPTAYEHVRGFLLKFTVLKIELLQDRQIHFLLASTRALFSPEIVPAVAV